MTMSRGNYGICLLSLVLALALMGSRLGPNHQTRFTRPCHPL